jgi:hypothetical protein
VDSPSREKSRLFYSQDSIEWDQLSVFAPQTYLVGHLIDGRKNQELDQYK